MPRYKNQHTIEITERIINTATVRDSSHCMIADAVREQVPNAVRVTVDLQTIRWSDPVQGLRFIAFTPPVGQKALVEFDQERKVQPFTLRLRPVQVQVSGQTDPTTGKPRHRSERKRIKERTHTAHSVEGVEIEGGAAPPAAALSNARGRRRAFGLRLSER